ncbi:hypothetical protein Acr_00g0084200 [Actinidia rufa]|uniref:Uncharacterized protein n=1 Tax=Actinidia rufa TaxID=165716 RepID=A0A7J0DV19_9ERIC|nr:hypothetical protein Acr_00g0084200 [Actinidia rufa]
MAHMAQVPRANTSNRAMEVVREFSKLNPPMFDGVSSDPLVADHWLSEIHKLFDVLDVTEDAMRVKLVACQLKEKKCKRFIRGLDDSIQKFVMSGGHTNFAAVLELARNLEASRVNKKNAKPSTTIVSAPTGSSGVVSGNYVNQNKKRQGEPLQFSRNRFTFRAPTSSVFGENSSKPPITCHQMWPTGPHSHSLPKSEDSSTSTISCSRGAHTQSHYRQTTSGQGSQVDRGASSSTPVQATQGWVFAVTAATPTTSYFSDSRVVRCAGAPLDRICWGCELVILDRRFEFDFIVLSMSGFDLILGMDWLSTYRATIDCFRRRVRICTPEGGCFEFFGERREPFEPYLYESRDKGSMACLLASFDTR